MGGHAAEQIIAGVVLSERLAVTPYGAIHRAQWSGQADLRGLVVDGKLLGEDSFRDALTDAVAIKAALALSASTIVPMVAVEEGGAEVVVVTRGVGRYVTVQDLIVAARASKASSGKLPHPVAAAIGKSVVEALAVAHQAGVAHGAVHPRSVLIDEDGAVRLGDFIVGRALATAVAKGAHSDAGFAGGSLWRGMSGYLAPELAVGEDPTPGCDVFAAGALLFAMLSGEAPPGNLRATPAVERLVQRALDTDPVRRYKSAADLLENLLEAFEDDHWEIAGRAEVIAAAGLSSTESAIDDATEDLLASLGSSANAVQVTPIRPSVDIRAEAISARQNKTPSTENRLDALLADLSDGAGSGEAKSTRLPTAAAPRPKRVPSLDDIDEDEPDDPDGFTPIPLAPPEPMRELQPRSASEAERRAFDVLADLEIPLGAADPAPARPAASPAASPAKVAPLPVKAERPPRRSPVRGVPVGEDSEPGLPMAAQLPVPARAESEPGPTPPAKRRTSAVVRPVARPVVDAPILVDMPVPRLKSRLRGVIGLLVIAGLVAGFYVLYNRQQAQRAADQVKADQQREEIEKTQAAMNASQPKSGAIAITSTPSEGAVWIKLGRTPLDSIALSSASMHEIRVENLDGYEPLDTQVLAANWGAADDKGVRRANVVVPLTASPKGKHAATRLPNEPPKPAAATGFTPGHGPIHIESTPPGAEVWMFLGVTNDAKITDVPAATPYELRVTKDGFHPNYVSISAEDWRATGEEPNKPLSAAKLKPLVERAVELAPEKGR